MKIETGLTWIKSANEVHLVVKKFHSKQLQRQNVLIQWDK